MRGRKPFHGSEAMFESSGGGSRPTRLGISHKKPFDVNALFCLTKQKQTFKNLFLNIDCLLYSFFLVN